MRDGICIRCKQGVLYFLGSTYRCAYCDYQEATLLASDMGVETMCEWASAELKKSQDIFFARPTQLFSNFPSSLKPGNFVFLMKHFL